MRREQGMALVLVLTVILALTLIATPFVLSMVLQERSGTMARYASQADWAADGSRNYAVWRLMQSLDPVERGARGGGATYYYDLPSELEVRLDDPQLAKKLKVADPKGSIWGLTVQDEQGKINVKSAPESLVGRVLGGIDPAVVSSKEFLTLYSGRDATWGVPQRVRPAGFDQGSGAGTGGTTCDSLHVLAPQSRVRVTKPGLAPFHARIAGNTLVNGAPPNTPHNFTTTPALPATYVDGMIEVELRHPVNVNTARRETLAAIFAGLSFVGDPQSRIDPGTANRLATAFAGRAFPRLEEFLRALTQQGLNPQQVQVVAINAVCPSYARLGGSGTVPFCFKTYDVYSIEAAGSMSNPAGAQMSARGYRTVVSVSPPNPLRQPVESQYDFDRMLASLAAAVQRADLLGFPYGNRMQTYPNLLPSPFPSEPPSRPNAPSDVALKTQQRAPDEAAVAMAPARDFRGVSAPAYEGAIAAGWQTGLPREHFDNDHEGRRLRGSAYALDWRRVFTSTPENQTGPGLPRRPDVTTGGYEMWIRFDGPPGGPTTLFDIREGDWMNRLTLRIENGELIFEACDGTMGDPNFPIDNGAAEVRQPFQPEADTWYHLGIYWKGTRFGQLAMLVDGFAHPDQKFRHVNPEGQEVSGRLSSGVTDTGSISGAVPSGVLAPSGLSVLRIGREVIVHDAGSGTTVRGARGSTAAPHEQGVPVAVFGYGAKFVNGTVTARWGPQVSRSVQYTRLPRTAPANLVSGFGMNPTAVVMGDKFDPTNPANRWVDAMQGDLWVACPTIMTEFPDQGYVYVDGEVIFYASRSLGGSPMAPGSDARFSGCQRGLHGTVAARHDNGRQVRLWGFPVTDQTGFDDATILQVDDEWIGPVWKDTTRPNFWISFVDQQRPYGLRRGLNCFRSIPGFHSGSRVLPTFLAENLDPNTPIEPMGRDDRITIMDGQNNKELHQVNHTSPIRQEWDEWVNSSPRIWDWPNRTQLVALRQEVQRDYDNNDPDTRALKFPSGELIGFNWLNQAGAATVNVGPLSATIDEVKVFATAEEHVELAGPLSAGVRQTAVDRASTEMPHAKGGLLKIGDEYVGMIDYDPGTGQVASARRAWLGSKEGVHDAGDAVFSLYWIPVSTLQRDLLDTDREIPLNQPLSARQGRPAFGNYTRGYVLIDEEMILFEWDGSPNRRGGGTLLGMPPTLDGQRGLYRGMFGTQPASHAAATALVYGLPWRYWDTYKAREFDNSMAYYQWSTQMDLAHWTSLRWQQDLPAGDPNLVVHCLVRVDGKGEFWDPPARNDRTLLWEFTTANSSHPLKRTGYRNDAGQLDVRFYVEYKSGAFDARAPWMTPSWKRTPRLREIVVDYDRPLQILHHEDQ